VAETWGAVLLTAQAEAASSPALRRFYARIARDEARHSALAVAIDRWLVARLDHDARRTLDRLQARALAQLEAAIDAPTVAASVRQQIGRPEGTALRAIWSRAHTELFESEGNDASVTPT